MRLILGFVLLSLFAISLSTAAFAETVDFGGFEEEFKGSGDKTPPRCQINIPRAAGAPFNIRWNCEDDVAEREVIRSELWITRQGADIASRQVESFLGFPAAAFIDEKQLGVTNFTDGLPATFRLIARDTAGNAAVSELFTIRSQDASLNNCTVTINTEGTTSTGGSTGLPPANVTISDAAVIASQESNEKTTNILTTGETAANPCEVDLVCTNGTDLTFSARVTTLSNGSASGTLTIPGSVFVEISGSASLDNAVITGLDLSGTTEIDDVGATVTLSCGQ